MRMRVIERAASVSVEPFDLAVVILVASQHFTEPVVIRVDGERLQQEGTNGIEQLALAEAILVGTTGVADG